MKNRLFVLLALLLAYMSAGTAVAADESGVNKKMRGKQLQQVDDLAPVVADEPGVYQLRPGDRIMVSVWREDSLQREVVVLPDGGITFPLIGRVEVAGLGTTGAEQKIAVRLKKFIPEPIVSVVIVGIEGSRAYVTGRVIRPGSLVINGPITVLQAISTVGGLDRFADEGGIKVIRVTAGGQVVLPVEYKAIMSGRDISTNILLEAGDTLVVP